MYSLITSGILQICGNRYFLSQPDKRQPAVRIRPEEPFPGKLFFPVYEKGKSIYALNFSGIAY